MSEKHINKSPLPQHEGRLGVGKIGYKQTSIGIIPQDWEVVRLGEICDLFAGGDVPKENFSKTKTTQYQIPIFSNGVGANALYGYTNQAKVDKPCITISARGTIGHCILHTKPFFPIVRLIVVLPSLSIDIAFLKNYIDLAGIESTNAGIPQLTIPMIRNLQIPLPPLKEQEKIARILGVWDSALDTLANLIKAKRKYKTALMQRLLTPPKDIDCHDLPKASLAMTTPPRHCEEALATKQSTKESLRFAGFSDKWQEFRLGDIGEIYQPQTIPQSDFTEMGYNVYGANGIIGKYHSYNHEKAQIAIACRGNSCGAVNFTIPKSWITGNAMVINLDNSKAVDKIFAYYTLLNSNLNYLITGSGQPQITGNIKNHKIKLPTLAEQKKIAQVLSACDKEIETLNLKFECLKAQKRGLMQQLLSGKVRVKC